MVSIHLTNNQPSVGWSWFSNAPPPASLEMTFFFDYGWSTAWDLESIIVESWDRGERRQHAQLQEDELKRRWNESGRTAPWIEETGFWSALPDPKSEYCNNNVSVPLPVLVIIDVVFYFDAMNTLELFEKEEGERCFNMIRVISAKITLMGVQGDLFMMHHALTC